MDDNYEPPSPMATPKAAQWKQGPDVPSSQQAITGAGGITAKKKKQLLSVLKKSQADAGSLFLQSTEAIRKGTSQNIASVSEANHQTAKAVADKNIAAGRDLNADANSQIGQNYDLLMNRMTETTDQMQEIILAPSLDEEDINKHDDAVELEVRAQLPVEKLIEDDTMTPKKITGKALIFPVGGGDDSGGESPDSSTSSGSSAGDAVTPTKMGPHQPTGWFAFGVASLKPSIPSIFRRTPAKKDPPAMKDRTAAQDRTVTFDLAAVEVDLVAAVKGNTLDVDVEDVENVLPPAKGKSYPAEATKTPTKAKKPAPKTPMAVAPTAGSMSARALRRLARENNADDG